MRYFSILEAWLEPKYKLIAQAPPGYDPGDTAQREGMLMIAATILFCANKMDSGEFFFIQDRYAKVMDLLQDPKYPGFIRRYPDPSYWGGLSDRMSRDQATPNVIGMSFLPTKAERNPSRHLWNFFKAHLLYRALLFTTNTRNNWAWPPGHPEYDEKEYRWKLPDITIGSFHGYYIRGFRAWPLYPLLWLLDIDMLINSLIKVLYYAKDPTNSDDLNHIVTMYQAELSMPTLFSKLSFWIYNKFRKYPDQNISAPHPKATNPAQACMNHYFRMSNEGPKLEQVYADVNTIMAETFSWKLKRKYD